MPVIRDIFLPEPLSRNARGDETRKRKMLVQHDRGADPLQEPGVPRPFEPYQVGSRLRADDFSVELANDDLTTDSIVTVTYTTDSRFSLPPPAPLPGEPEFLGVGWDTQDDVIAIPSFVAADRAYQRVDPVTGPYVARGIEWVAEPYEARITYQVVERTVLVAVADRAAARTLLLTLRARHLKYHFFDATFWLFKVRSARQSAVGEYRIDYLWQSDPGTPAIGASTASRIVPGIDRPPFWRYVVIPSVAPSPADPFPAPYIDVEPNDGAGMNDFDGWRTLPGDPFA